MVWNKLGSVPFFWKTREKVLIDQVQGAAVWAKELTQLVGVTVKTQKAKQGRWDYRHDKIQPKVSEAVGQVVTTIKQKPKFNRTLVQGCNMVALTQPMPGPNCMKVSERPSLAQAQA